MFKWLRALILIADEIDSVLGEGYRLLIEASNKEIQELWDLQYYINRNIKPGEGTYEYIEGAFRPNIEKILELLSGVELYGSNLFAVRELLQNAFDAVRKQIAYDCLQYLEKDIPKGKTPEEIAQLAIDYQKNQGENYHVNLKVELREGDVWLVCTDTGVGMTKDIIENYLLVSGTARRFKIIDLERQFGQLSFDGVIP